MSQSKVSDEDLGRLRKLAEAASPAPWDSWVEGRDHHGGDNFIRIGGYDDQHEDLYLRRDTGPASVADQDFVAAARNYLVPLLDEIDRLKARLKEANR